MMDDDPDEELDDGEYIGDAVPNDGEKTVTEFDPGGKDTRMAIIDPNDLIGRTYLTAPAEDGQRMRLRIVEVLEDEEDVRLKDPTLIKFKAVNGQDTYEEIIAYNQLMGYLEDKDGDNDTWRFRRISAHEGPLSPSDERYKGSQWNLQME